MDLILVLFKEDIVEFFSSIHVGAVENGRFDSLFHEMLHGTDHDHIDDGAADGAGGGTYFLLHSGKKHAVILKIAAVINDNVTDLMKLFPAFVAAGDAAGILHVRDGDSGDAHFTGLQSHFNGGGVAS